MSVTAGIDVGSTYTKAVVTDEAGAILGSTSFPTGYNFARAAERALSETLDSAGLTREDIAYIAATGYGRHMVPFRDLAITELTCHAHAAHRLFPEARTLLDVGGQTVKAIRMDGLGRVKAFRLNDKCAAGSGAFLEKTVRYLGYEPSDIPRLSDEATDPAEVSSVCAVFAESEVINHLAAGRSAEDVCAGAVVALAGRAAQIVKRVRPEPPYVLSGGLTIVPLMRRMLEESLKVTFQVPDPRIGIQLGAIGGSLLAGQRHRKLTERISA